MSQSPYTPQGPYTPPTNYAAGYDYGPDPLGPAKRAGILMYVLGGMTFVSSFCCVGAGVSLPKLMADQPEAFAELQQIPNASMGTIQVAMFVLAGLVFFVGLIMIVLGTFVRGGSKGAIITAMVLTVLTMLLLALWLLSSAVHLLAPPGVHSLGLCMFLVPLALFGLLLFWLIGAMRAADRAMAGQYAMQYLQYAQQQQQTYGQYGYPQQQPQPPQSQQPPPMPPPPPQA